MNGPERLDLMVDALDLLGCLDDQQLVITTALMQAMLPPRKWRTQQSARIKAHTRQFSEENRERLAALLDVLRGEG